MFANGVLEGFLEYISCASASITSACERTASSLCDRGKSWVGESFPPILLLSLEWNVRARAETTNPIRLFCLCAPVNGAHMAVSVFARWLVALSSQWENLQPKTTVPHLFLLFFFFFLRSQLQTRHATCVNNVMSHSCAAHKGCAGVWKSWVDAAGVSARGFLRSLGAAED